MTNNTMANTSTKFAFFGSSKLSVIVLNELKKFELVPSVIVTTPDKPRGRKLKLTPNVVKQWAIDNNVPYHDPAKLDDNFVKSLKIDSDIFEIQLFIVASYGKIIPDSVLSIPPKGALNIHPSLLPKYRGPSPLPTTMVDDDKHTGVTIMKIDSEMDHGPIISQKQIEILDWPTYEEFEEMMAIVGAHLLADSIPKYLAGLYRPMDQDHSKATFTKKITKEDGLIDMCYPIEDQYLNFRKIQAYHEWPQAYFFVNHKDKPLRVKVTRASFKDDKLTIEKVIPEGSKEMSYKDFLNGFK